MNLDITMHQVKETAAYKNASPVLKMLTAKLNSLRAINNNVKVAENIGVKTWLKQTNATHLHKEITLELLLKRQKK